eukprot:CAMPEP_0205929602 /NCGR_PEP_ID=MMETSP1325-20131115/25397_1 /ASSEMBLY_ACC=CAM_ASM_000708 /TAXON_ID=236786 /ORGANISM="Florenciella sp., Strain RCC1007" /LENGTH=477 /DNA_ID=CAMNT_0053298837 /DNA_START=29 /DNA_END=1462 /DNA_ORIENTATION=+
MFSKVVLALALTASAANASTDTDRARSKSPGRHVQGEGLRDIRNKLNAALENAYNNLVPCENMTLGEVYDVLETLHSARDHALEVIYQETDDSRRLAANGVKSHKIETLKAHWAREAHIVEANPQLHDVARDGKCHDAVMWFTHHVPDERKNELFESGALEVMPKLPVNEMPHTTGPFYGNTNQAAVEYVFNNYGAGLSCGIAHAADQTITTNTEANVWPDSLSYSATGYGAFPFWDNTGAGCTYCDPSVDTPSSLKVKYDATQNSELLMHSSCGDMSWTGDSNAPNGSPCNHIFNSTYGAFIYTPVNALEPEADGEFCCRTFSAGDSNFPGAVPTNWMQSMNYWGSNTGFEGDYYSGEIKIYWYTMGGIDFWYYEDIDGNPVEQGEGCQYPGVGEKTACAYTLPIMLWHDYDPDTFVAESHTVDEFEVPEVCLATTVSCSAPGGSVGHGYGHAAAGHQIDHSQPISAAARAAFSRR